MAPRETQRSLTGFIRRNYNESGIPTTTHQVIPIFLGFLNQPQQSIDYDFSALEFIWIQILEFRNQNIPFSLINSFKMNNSYKT